MTNLKKDKQPSISLCMIVKNEEKLLPQCLESVKDVVDEMIIVDTGSTDRTVEIAESFGAKVYNHPWQGNFGEARNYCLQFAKGDWILQMDADEALERADIHILKYAIQSQKINAIFVAILNDTTEGWSKHYYQRVFRRGKGKYDGIVHEQMVYSGADLMTEIRLYHYGYNFSEDKMQVKYRRNEELLLKQLEEDPTNPYTYLNYLRILRAQKRYSETVAQGKKALEICRDRLDEIFVQMISYDTTYCMMMLKDYQEAERMARNILMKHPNNLDFLYTIGAVLIYQKRFEEAISVYSQFLKAHQKAHQKTKVTRLIVDTYSFDHRVLGNMAECHLELGRIEEAEKAAKKAIAAGPHYPIYRILLARVRLKAGLGEEAKSVMEKAEEECRINSDFYLKWMVISNLNPNWMRPRDVLSRGLSRFPDSADLLNAYACVILPDSASEAEKAWRRTLVQNPAHIGAHSGLVKLYAQTGKTVEFLAEADYLLRNAQSSALLRETAGHCIAAGQFAKAIDLFVKLLEQNPGDVEALCDISTCYAKLGKIESAVMGYQAVIQMAPDNERALKNLEVLLRMTSANNPS